MDGNIATIIIAIITGIFGVITIVIQKKQDKVITKISEQTVLIEKERKLRQRLDQKKKELEAVTYKMIVLILDTNLSIFRDMPNHSVESEKDVHEASEKLKKEFHEITDEIERLTTEYNMVVEMTEQYQKDLKKEMK